jgi:hypothetical protein
MRIKMAKNEELTAEYLRSILVYDPMIGEWPVDQIDHKNGTRSDNMFVNLRECNNSENNANRQRQTNSTSGFKGVCWNNRAKKWMAHIKVLQKQIHLGYFDAPEDAHAAYIEASALNFGEFARIG